MKELPYLLLIIIAPPLVTIFTIKFITTTITKSKTTIRSLFTLNPEKGAMEQTLLWVCLSVPVAYFLVTGYFSWRTCTISISAEGFNTFIKVSTLPLGLLSLAIPLSILALRLHSTQQTALQIAKTKRQIEITEKKNNIDTFYAHRKALIEYFEKIGPSTYQGGIEAKFAAHPRLHIKFFMNTPPEAGIPQINEEQFSTAIRKLRRARIYIAVALNSYKPLKGSLPLLKKDKQRHYYKHAPNVKAIAYAKACAALFDLGNLLVLPEIYTDLKSRAKLLTLEQSYRASPISFNAITTSDSVLGAYRYIRSYLRVLCEFSSYPVEYFVQPSLHGHIDNRADAENLISHDTTESLIARVREITQQTRKPRTKRAR